MPEETLPEAEIAEAPKGGVLSLIIAIIALIVAGAAIVINLTIKPDTSAIEARIQTVEASVQVNADNIAALSDVQSKMDETVSAIVDEKLAEQATAEETEEVEEATDAEEAAE